MAKFSCNGLDELSASFEQLSKLTDDDKRAIIMPAAQLLLEKQKDKIKAVFTQRTGQLAESLTIEEKTGENGIYAWIFPKGKHSGSSTGKRKGKRRSNGSYSGTNSEIAWVLEHGSARIPAKHWMETANEEAEEEVIAAQQAAWDEIVTKKGL